MSRQSLLDMLPHFVGIAAEDISHDTHRSFNVGGEALLVDQVDRLGVGAGETLGQLFGFAHVTQSVRSSPWNLIATGKRGIPSGV